MKEIIAQMLAVALIYVPIMFGLAIAFFALKKYGDRQRERDRINEDTYEDRYSYIKILISDMLVNNMHYNFIHGCIAEIEAFPHKNREKTDALYRQLDKRFKPAEIHQMIEL